MIGFIRKYPLLVLMCVALLMLVSHLGLIQTNIMEARNLIAAREMVNDGHWIFTTLNGMPRYEKPPLPTWITAFFMLIGGTKNMFWLRLPVVLAAIMLVYFFYKLSKKILQKNEHALTASLILITSFYIFFAGRDNQWDMYTHAFMIVCIYFLFNAFNEKEQLTKNIILSGLFFGFSFLSKGPVSFYALMLSFLLAYFIVYRNNAGKNSLKVLLVLVIGLLIGFSWPLYVKYFDAYAGTALAKQAQNWSNYEVKPYWYYWSFFTQSGVWTIPSFIALMYFYMRRRVQNVKAYTFSFLWTIISVILLSIIPEKKARYLLPVLIPLALNTSFYIEYLIAEFKNIKSKLESSIVYFSFGLIGCICMIIPFIVFYIFKSKIAGHISWYVLLSICSFCCGYSILSGLYKKKFKLTFYAIILFMCGLVITVIPLSKMYYINNEFSAASNIKSVEKKYHVKTYEGDEFVPEIIWNYGSALPNLSTTKTITLPKDSLFGLLIDSSKMAGFQKQFINYSFKKIAAIDLNLLSKNEKGYNSRLTKDYYIVRKKR